MNRFNHLKIKIMQVYSRSLRNINFQPLRLARTAKSMSSTVVRSFQPPASLMAAIRHTPAVPAKRIHFFSYSTMTPESIGGGSHLLLDSKMVIQGHLLHPCHQTFIRVHCDTCIASARIGL